MFAALVGVLAVLAAVAQLTVIRDKTVCESDVVSATRRVRVAAWLILALYCLWRTADGWELPPVMLLALSGLALMDAVAPMTKLFPEDPCGKQ